MSTSSALKDLAIHHVAYWTVLIEHLVFPVDDFLTPCNSISRKEQLDGPCDIHVILLVIVKTSQQPKKNSITMFSLDGNGLLGYFSRRDAAIKSRNGQ